MYAIIDKQSKEVVTRGLTSFMVEFLKQKSRGRLPYDVKLESSITIEQKGEKLFQVS